MSALKELMLDMIHSVEFILSLSDVMPSDSSSSSSSSSQLGSITSSSVVAPVEFIETSFETSSLHQDAEREVKYMAGRILESQQLATEQSKHEKFLLQKEEEDRRVLEIAEQEAQAELERDMAARADRKRKRDEEMAIAKAARAALRRTQSAVSKQYVCIFMHCLCLFPLDLLFFSSTAYNMF